MTSQRQEVISQPELIADRLVDLTRNNGRNITLRFTDTVLDYPAILASVDRMRQQCLVYISDIADAMDALSHGRPFILKANLESETIESTPIRCASADAHSDRIAVRCAFPAQVCISRSRQSFRAALITNMAIRVTLKTATQRPCEGLLKDLSVGGCLMTLTQAASATPYRVDQPASIGIHFPNGEAFTTEGRISHVGQTGEGETGAIGIAFEFNTPDKENQVDYYVREIEREATRRTSDRPEMRPLAQSRLFTPAKTPDDA